MPQQLDPEFPELSTDGVCVKESVGGKDADTPAHPNLVSWPGKGETTVPATSGMPGFGEAPKNPLEDFPTDVLVDLFEEVRTQEADLYDRKRALVAEIARRTEGDTKTRRLTGKDRTVKVEMPDDSWDQSILKEAFNAYPQHRDKCLKIGEINIQLREWKKIMNTTGEQDFNLFRDMVKSANRGPTGNPRVTIEK